MAADGPLDRFSPRRVDTGRIVLNVREGGSGPLILFFHGITANSAVFAPLIEPVHHNRCRSEGARPQRQAGDRLRRR